MSGSAEQLNTPPANNQTKASNSLNLESFNHSSLHCIVPKWNKHSISIKSLIYIYKTLNRCNKVFTTNGESRKTTSNADKNTSSTLIEVTNNVSKYRNNAE